MGLSNLPPGVTDRMIEEQAGQGDAQLSHDDKVNKLNVHSIYPSISGEAGPVFPQGAVCIFLRLQGCPLRCTWCDTADSLPYTVAYIMSVETVVKHCLALGIMNVVLTGGEPLSQIQAVPLIRALLDNGFKVQVETSGAIEIPEVTGGLRDWLGWVVDVKMPASGEARRNKPSHRLVTSRPTYFKFVCADQYDIHYAMNVASYVTCIPAYFVLSPVDARLDVARDIVEAIRDAPLALRSRMVLSLQIHKYLDAP